MKAINHVSKLLVLILFALIPVLFFPPPCLSSNGVLLMVKGKVNIRLHGATSPAKTGLRLQPGVTVKSLGGTASILLSNGRMARVEEGASFTLPEEEGEGGQDTMAARLMDTIRETAHRGRGPSIKGMVRGESEITPVYPFNSYVTSGDLRFEWAPLEGLEDIEITIKAPSPVYRYTFRPKAGETSATLPEGATALSPEIRYYWKVNGFHKIKGEPYSSKLCWFAVLGGERSEALKREEQKLDAMPGLDEAARAFLRANLLISYELYHSAVSVLKGVLDQSPDDEGLKELLAGLLLKMKQFEEADRYMKEAEK